MWFETAGRERILIDENFFSDFNMNLAKVKLEKKKEEAVKRYLLNHPEAVNKNISLRLYSPHGYYMGGYLGGGSSYAFAMAGDVKNFLDRLLELIGGERETPEEMFLRITSSLVEEKGIRFLFEGWNFHALGQTPGCILPFLVYGNYLINMPINLDYYRKRLKENRVNFPDRNREASVPELGHRMESLNGEYEFSSSVLAGFIGKEGVGSHSILVPKPHIWYPWTWPDVNQSREYFASIAMHFMLHAIFLKELKLKKNREESKSFVEKLIKEGILRKKERYAADDYTAAVSVGGVGRLSAGGVILEESMLTVNNLIRSKFHEMLERKLETTSMDETKMDYKELNVFQSLEEKERILLQNLRLMKKFYEEMIEEYRELRKDVNWWEVPIKTWKVRRDGGFLHVEPTDGVWQHSEAYRYNGVELTLATFLSMDWMQVIPFYEKVYRVYAKKSLKFMRKEDRYILSINIGLLTDYLVTGRLGRPMKNDEVVFTGLVTARNIVNGRQLFLFPYDRIVHYRLLKETFGDISERDPEHEDEYELVIKSAELLWDTTLEALERLGMEKEFIEEFRLWSDKTRGRNYILQKKGL